MDSLRLADIVEQSDEAVFDDGFMAGFEAGHRAGGNAMMNYIMGWWGQGQPDWAEDYNRYNERRP
jgi:hypothetical protein